MGRSGTRAIVRVDPNWGTGRGAVEIGQMDPSSWAGRGLTGPPGERTVGWSPDPVEHIVQATRACLARCLPRFGDSPDAAAIRSVLIRIAFASSYPPRRCGIASYTSDLGRASGNREIVALTPPDHETPYPTEVHHRIRRDVPEDYGRVARALDGCRVDAVSIQHDFSIWGGPDGEFVLDFVRALNLPAVATLHELGRRPTPNQRRIVGELVDATAATVVMSQAAAGLLGRAYGIDPGRVEVISHGVPDLPLVDPAQAKAGLALSEAPFLLSFGLLGPGKGYELAIAAMPAVVAAVPTARYVILGITHQDLLRREGEAYRRSLQEQIRTLGLTNHVELVDRFVGRTELGRWLQAADIFVTPYPNLEQSVSGTLAHAMGAGKAIVSTPFAYASELLAGGRGVLAKPDPAALATAFIALLGDPAKRKAIGARAHAYSRDMLWPGVGQRYLQLFERVTEKRPLIARRRLLESANA
jgi:glycosyltransferase involved in cell wall biosynthesis